MDGLGAQVDSLCAVEGVVEDDRNERCGILHRLEGRGNTGHSAGRRTTLYE